MSFTIFLYLASFSLMAFAVLSFVFRKYVIAGSFLFVTGLVVCVAAWFSKHVFIIGKPVAMAIIIGEGVLFTLLVIKRLRVYEGSQERRSAVVKATALNAITVVAVVLLGMRLPM